MVIEGFEIIVNASNSVFICCLKKTLCHLLLLLKMRSLQLTIETQLLTEWKHWQESKCYSAHTLCLRTCHLNNSVVNLYVHCEPL